ncbi:MAG: sigma factor-like helix-turn-helix DNA-binding protein [Bacilli bacterium]
MEWNIDEEVLLIELYFNIKNKVAVDEKDAIFNLSKRLNQRAILMKINKDETFRSENEIDMKLQKLNYFDSSAGNVVFNEPTEIKLLSCYYKHKKKFNLLLNQANQCLLDKCNAQTVNENSLMFIELNEFYKNVDNKNNKKNEMNVIDYQNVKTVQEKCISKSENDEVYSVFSVANTLDTRDPDLLFLSRYKEAIYNVDLDLKLLIYNNPNSLKYVYHVLKEIINNANILLERKKRIRILIEKLKFSKRQLLLYPYVLFFKIDEIMNNPMYKNSRIKDLEFISDELICEYQIYNKIVELLKWMNNDYYECINNLFTKLFVKDSYMKTISERSKGKTLEEIGNEIHVTRERIRQIEFKVQTKFDSKNKTNNYLLQTMTYLGLDNIISLEEIEAVDKLYGKPLAYLLLKSKNESFFVDSASKTFYLNNETNLNTLYFFNQLPEEISNTEYNDIIQKVKENSLEINFFEILIKSYYKKTGDYLFSKGLSLYKVYSIILKKYFPNGMRIYDEKELEKFKRLICKDFGSMKFSKNDRAIAGRLADIGILCDRGTYCYKKEYYISKDLLKEICNTINESEKSIWPMSTLYYIFRKRLNEEGIMNKYYLYGILKELLNDKFVFKKDYLISGDSESTIYSEILSFIKSKRYPITHKDIQKEYPGITDIIINIAMTEPGIINLFGEYIHVSALKMTPHENLTLQNNLHKLLSDNKIHHQSDIFSLMQKDVPEVVSRNFIKYPFCAFSLCEELFSDDFQFKRPFIAFKNIKIGLASERLREFVNTKDLIEIREIIDFAKENKFGINSLLNLLNSFNETHYIYSKSLLIRIDYLELSIENISKLENDILDFLVNNQTVKIKQILYSLDLPIISKKWTDWLIYSIVKKSMNKLEVDVTVKQFSNAVPIIAKKGTMIKSKFEGIYDKKECIKTINDCDDIDTLLEDYLATEMSLSEGNSNEL